MKYLKKLYFVNKVTYFQYTHELHTNEYLTNHLKTLKTLCKTYDCNLKIKVYLSSTLYLNISIQT